MGSKIYSCQRILRPKEEWIPISIPPIIDLETFHQAGIRVKDNQRFSPRNLQEDAYLLRRLVRCGHCGLSCRVSSNTANPCRSSKLNRLAWMFPTFSALLPASGCSVVSGRDGS